jgi:glycosyltransferase involved in cell wall biosynthesis/SAM-dependent methyltransferase
MPFPPTLESNPTSPRLAVMAGSRSASTEEHNRQTEPAPTPIKESLLLPANSDIRSLDFDQLQRYSITARLLDRMLAGAPCPVRVLEVGANVLNLLPKFLDPTRVHVTRCDVERLSDDPEFVAIEKNKPLPFADESFDAVATLEVLEHIPPEDRRFFIEECLRVSRRGLVMTCPNGVPEVVAAERLAAEAYRFRHGRPHPSLSEHLDHGIPQEEEVRSLVQELGLPCVVFDNAPLDVWLPIMMISESLFERKALSQCNYRLNQILMAAESSGGSIPYRKVYVVTKEGAKIEDREWRMEDLGSRIEDRVAGNVDGRAVDAPSSTLDPQSSGSGWPLATVDRLVAIASDALSAAESCRHHEVATLQRELQEREAELVGLNERFVILNSMVTSMMHSGFWRLLAPLRALRQLVRPRGFGLDDLMPWNQLDEVPNEPDHWMSTGTDPQFLVPCCLPAGWLRIRLKMTSQVQGRFEIFLDTGHGFSSAECVERIIIGNGIDQDSYVRLPLPVRAVRIDPLDVEGEFHLQELHVEPVPGPVALLRAIRSKVRVLWEYGILWQSLGRGLLLLLRGRLPQFRQKLDKGLTRSSYESPDWYDANKAYEVWRRLYQLTDSDREHMRQEAATFDNSPLISVLMPVYNVKVGLLRKAIDSVLLQTYPHWELCIADDASQSPRIRATLEEYARRDSRIKVVFRTERGNISAASNSALALATGEYVALLDNDDELAEQALFRVAKAIIADRDLDLIYSDEDKLEPDGRHVDPFFKPDWSPEYFLTCMYTCHLGVYRTALVRELGGFRSELDSAQDYDLALRIVARSHRVGHIPDVLYHWRKLPNSTARSHRAKPQAFETACRALASYLTIKGQPGRVEPGPFAGLHRVRFNILGRPKVSIVIPTASRPARIRGHDTSFISHCVQSIRRSTRYPHYEIITVDNDDMPPDLQRELDRWKVRRVSFTDEFNLASKMNLGAAKADGDHLLFLNDDTEIITPDWLECMLEYSQQPEIGAVGAKLLFPDGRIQHVGVVLLDGDPCHPFYANGGKDMGYWAGNYLTRNTSAVTGACLMTRADLFHELGGFDEAFPLNYNDVDYCLRVNERGKRVVFTPYAQLYHYEGATKSGITPEELEAFKKRWQDKWSRDPYYNPNLSLNYHDYRIQTAEEILAVKQGKKVDRRR